jgi:hypothetical protein
MIVVRTFLNYYKVHQEAIMCNLRSTEMDYTMWKAYVILVLLLECAELTSKDLWLAPEILECNPMGALRRKYKPSTALDKVIIVFMQPTIERFHSKNFDYQSMDMISAACFPRYTNLIRQKNRQNSWSSVSQKQRWPRGVRFLVKKP